MNKDKIALWQAIATIMGSVMGAGILGLPYALLHGGLLNGLLFLIIVGFLIMILHLFVGEMILSNTKSHQLTGIANEYLGPVGKWVMFQVFMVASYGSLLAYMIGGGEVLSALFNGASKIWTLIFFSIGSIFLYIGLKAIKKVGVFMILGLFVVIGVIAFSCLGNWQVVNILDFQFSKFFYSYGVILYSFLGASSIYQARSILKGKEKLLRKAIISSSAIIIFLYIIFAVLVVGVTGIGTSEVATVALGELIGPKINILGNLFALFTLTTSFLTLGNAVKETYFYDFDLIKDKELDRFLSWILTISIPLFLFIMGNNDFIRILGFVGAVAGGLEGILLILTYLRFKKRKKYNRKAEYTVHLYKIWAYTLFFMFIGGILYSLIS